MLACAWECLISRKQWHALHSRLSRSLKLGRGGTCWLCNVRFVSYICCRSSSSCCSSPTGLGSLAHRKAHENLAVLCHSSMSGRSSHSFVSQLDAAERELPGDIYIAIPTFVVLEHNPFSKHSPLSHQIVGRCASGSVWPDLHWQTHIHHMQLVTPMPAGSMARDCERAAA